jgi:hypothetical protein
MLRIGSNVWGIRNVPRAIEFWCAALNYRPLREPSDDWAILVPRDGPGPQMAITVVSSDAQTHQRHHLDLCATDREAEVDRLLALGAKGGLAIPRGRRLHRAGRSGRQHVLCRPEVTAIWRKPANARSCRAVPASPTFIRIAARPVGRSCAIRQQ